MRAARLRASKLPNPVICTFAPFFNSPAMMPLSSNRASIVRVASAFDILVRMARAAVSSALFTRSPCGGLRAGESLEVSPLFSGGRPKSPKSRHNMGVCRENPQDTSTSLTPLPPAATLPPPVSRRQDAMFHGTRPGWIEVISGVRFAGKREELIRRVRRAVIARQQVQVFKSHLDARYAGLYSVTSHDGLSVDAEPVVSADQIMRQVRPDTEVVAIDEAQFLDGGIVTVANALADRGVRVIVAGTDSDFRGEPFGAMPILMAAAEIVDKLQAICVVCGGPATRNQRLVNGKPAPWDSPTIMVGGRESYEARCRHCHRVPKRDEDQTALL